MDVTLARLESDAVEVLREARRRYRKVAVLWSMGKDSTTVLWLIRKAFFGDVPFPVLHIDTSYKFAAMYEFRERMAAEWRLDLRVHRNEPALAAGMSPFTRTRLECCTSLKTAALRRAVEVEGLEAIILGIRGDEHAVRAKERVFSRRSAEGAWTPGAQPPELWDLYGATPDPGGHVRVHPLLPWREVDVWGYIESEGIPVPSLYFADGGTRYRSIGCRTCCAPVQSVATTVPEVLSEVRTSTASERDGRAQDKEDAGAMEKLRALGYM